ncbi:MAG: DUF2520 domain-containing protein [Polyangiaceae bacterium]|jgi:predicted short-subunit dehydrogenase-like oxidoreductase (DUF2520 family)|nr:DUF2520 domain-containing protein [Polyangiaceae bacterium]
MSRRDPPLSVAILGAGKVGVGLARALRQAGVPCSLRAGRAALPSRPFRASILVLAVRDGALGPLVQALIERRLVTPAIAVVHAAGALDAEVLAPLRPWCAGVAQMHPMISFADPRFPPQLRGGHAHVQGDPAAIRRARRLCQRVGLRPRTFPGLDTVAYHAAAGLVANGAAALAAAGTDLLRRAGARPEAIPHMLGPLLRSVADNVELLGMPAALTGPVRRGDPKGVMKHLATLRAVAPALVPLYLATVKAQIPLARDVGDAPAEVYDQLERELVHVDPASHQH